MKNEEFTEEELKEKFLTFIPEFKTCFYLLKKDKNFNNLIQFDRIEYDLDEPFIFLDKTILIRPVNKITKSIVGDLYQLGFALDLSVYDPGSYWEPPSEDYAELNVCSNPFEAILKSMQELFKIQMENFATSMVYEPISQCEIDNYGEEQSYFINYYEHCERAWQENNCKKINNVECPVCKESIKPCFSQEITNGKIVDAIEH